MEDSADAIKWLCIAIAVTVASVTYWQTTVDANKRTQTSTLQALGMPAVNAKCVADAKSADDIPPCVNKASALLGAPL